MKRIISVDPGASGGFAWMEATGFVACMAMPKTEGDIVELINETLLGTTTDSVEVWIEEVGGYVGVGQPGSSAFKFGYGAGFIKGAYMARYTRLQMVRPQKWQKHFSLGTAKAAGSKTAWKNKLKQRAQQLFPQCQVTLLTADALLILDYARTHP